MKKTRLLVILLALLPVVAQAQADKKLISKAEKGDCAAIVTLGECYENGAGVPLDSTLALKWYQKGAAMGDGNCSIRISKYYLHGTLLPKDTARYFAIRKEWADKGLPNGLAALASAYEFGYGTKADTAKTLDLYEQSLKKGSSWGYFNMGLNYLYGDLGLKKDSKKALSYLQKAYKLGEHDAATIIGTYYLQAGDYKQARKWFDEGKKWGDPHAVAGIAEMHWLGKGVVTDEAMAQEILYNLIGKYHNLDYVQMMAGFYYMNADSAALRDSAKALRIWNEGDARGFESCQSVLGDYYRSKEVTTTAYHYFRKVALNDNARNSYGGYACWTIASMYASGEMGDTNISEAINWLNRGVDQFKDTRCAMLLASIYEEYPAYKDMPMAVKYYRAAAKYGDTTALAVLGQIYARNGNDQLAADCFQEMIDNGQPEGYYWMAMIYDNQGDAKKCNEYLFKGDKAGSKLSSETLGAIYENGIDNYKVDYKKAAQYYEKAGSSHAFYRLAVLYIDGHLNKKGEASDAEMKQGLQYLEQAAAMGDLEAIYTLGYCYEKGIAVDSADLKKAVECYSYVADAGIAAGQFKMGCAYESGTGVDQADSLKAVAYFRQAAEQGHGEAMCFLGDFHRIGQFLPLDKAQAFSYYTQAHEAGEEIGTYYVGRSYLEGCGVDIDTAAAIPYLKAAAAMGVGNAAYRLGEFYNHGLGGLSANGDSAIYYYVKGHENGSGDASFVLGSLLVSEGQYSSAVEYYYTGATRGNLESSLAFAACLQNGIGIEPDPRQAYQIYENLVNNTHDARAYTQLGAACLSGIGCPEDEVLGRAYLDTAANMGNVIAMYNLGICHLNGYGCRIDTTTAIYWLEQAADNESVKAINELGDVYEAQGDFKNAVLYYEKGIAMNNYDSYCNLGYCYEQGTGVVLNSQKAFELYKYAADHGSARGCICVANCYMYGTYVDKSAAEALNWFTKAAEAGNVIAMYYCGNILENGADGVKPDIKKAREWYKAAAAAGYDPAAAALARMK